VKTHPVGEGAGIHRSIQDAAVVSVVGFLLAFTGGFVDFLVDSLDALLEFDDSLAQAAANVGQPIPKKQHRDQTDNDQFSGTGHAKSQKYLFCYHVIIPENIISIKNGKKASFEPLERTTPEIITDPAEKSNILFRSFSCRMSDNFQGLKKIPPKMNLVALGWFDRAGDYFFYGRSNKDLL